MSVTDAVTLPELSTLSAVSPLDGRYARHTKELRHYVSEFGLIRYRLKVEVEWLLALAMESDFESLQPFDKATQSFLRKLSDEFDIAAAREVKVIEATTNHDVKAVEYFMRDRFEDHAALTSAVPFIHFACTSEDINNLSYSLMLRDARDQVVIPALTDIVEQLGVLANAHADAAMLSRTHGQSATPTTMGKEMANVAARLDGQLKTLAAVELRGKINGAVGNYNAHIVACPGVDWPRFAADFVSTLGLEFNPHTTQIEPHDCIAEYADALRRICTILIDFSRDVWTYISLGYFRQRKLDNEVGSSTMPHKVNPIDFENAEGNLGMATALLEHFAHKLPVSRMQRDLTDSTVLRNLGSALGYVLIACRSLEKGISKLELDGERLASDLDHAWEVLAEPIQTVMRYYGIADSYEQLKALTRGQAIDADSLREFVQTLDVPAAAKSELLALTPAGYIGLAATLARDV